MPNPAQPAAQREIYNRFAELFGREWADQNWQSIARSVNRNGYEGTMGFLDNVEQEFQQKGIRQASGSGAFTPGRITPFTQAGKGDGYRVPGFKALEQAGLAGPDESSDIEQRLVDLANNPYGSDMVDDLAPQIRDMVESGRGFSGNEEQLLDRLITGAERQTQHRTENPDAARYEDQVRALIDPTYTSQYQTPDQVGRRINTSYVNPDDYEWMRRGLMQGTQAAGSDVGSDYAGDTIGQTQASMAAHREALEEQLRDPNLTEEGRQYLNKQLDSMGGAINTAMNNIPYLMAPGGPLAYLGMPNPVDHMSQMEATAAGQMAGGPLPRNFRDISRGGAGFLAARALGMMNPDAFQYTDADSKVMHAGDPTNPLGVGVGGYYDEVTDDQMRSAAGEYIRQLEAEGGPIDPGARTQIMSEYVNWGRQVNAQRPQRQQQYNQNTQNDRRVEQNVNTVSQAFMPEDIAARQARAFTPGGVPKAPPKPPTNAVGRAWQGGKNWVGRNIANPLINKPGMVGSMSRGAANTGSWLGNRIRPFGAMGAVTGLAGAIPTAMNTNSQVNAIKGQDGTVGSITGDAIGSALPYASGALTFAGTEVGIPTAVKGGYDAARAIKPLGSTMQGAGNALRSGMTSVGSGGAGFWGRMGQRAGNMWQGAKNIATMKPLVGGLRGAFSPGAWNPGSWSNVGKGVGALKSGMGRMSGGLMAAQAAMDLAANSGDIYGSWYGDANQKAQIQQQTQQMAKDYNNQSALGRLGSAGNAASNIRATLGAHQLAQGADQSYADTYQQNYDNLQRNAHQQAMQTALGESPEAQTYMKMRHDYGDAPEVFDRWLQTNPRADQMQAIHDQYNLANRSYSRNRASSGVDAAVQDIASFRRGPSNMGYAGQVGDLANRTFNGGYAGRSLAQEYGSNEAITRAIDNLSQGVEAGQISDELASHVLGPGAPTKNLGHHLQQIRSGNQAKLEKADRAVARQDMNPLARAYDYWTDW